jgi:hypothetical protein
LRVFTQAFAYFCCFSCCFVPPPTVVTDVVATLTISTASPGRFNHARSWQ